MKDSDLNIEWWDIDRPKDYPKNARKWSAQAVDKVASSIREYGWRQPIVVDRHEVIAIGHLRRTAGRSLGLTQCPVHVARDLTPAQIRGLRLADNRTNQEAEWDLDLLGPELLDLKSLDFDLNLTGFDGKEIDQFLRGTGDSEKEDAVPEPPANPVTRPGDLWPLGDQGHRLLCGDSTKLEDVARLMGGQLADMVFIDSPYNVDYEGYTADKMTILGDRMKPEEFDQFLRSAFANIRESIKLGAALYVCHASSVQREFQNALEAAGCEVRCQIIWAKNTFG
jgi:hypothetical protein